MVTEQNEIVPSRFRFGYSEKCGRPAIIYKETGEVYESFSLNCDELLVVQRLAEIRDDEEIRAKIVAGTSLDTTQNSGLYTNVEQSGLII
jgi:hypothetical protein